VKSQPESRLTHRRRHLQKSTLVSCLRAVVAISLDLWVVYRRPSMWNVFTYISARFCRLAGLHLSSGASAPTFRRDFVGLQAYTCQVVLLSLHFGAIL